MAHFYTVVETPVCQRYSESIWSEKERLEFISWLAHNPLAGDVIPGSGGIRKVRWNAGGKGKRGGVRAIYHNVLAEGLIYLLIVYTKSWYDNISTKTLVRMKEEIENG
ncbi:MAG: transcriptional regulator [Burkholderiaceae bacterium]|nr:transcriptional regulator [Burkholderiaceae bacterium]